MEYRNDHFLDEYTLKNTEPKVYQPRSKPPKSGKFSKWIVVVSILTILAYTGAVMYFVWHDKFVPDSLIYSFFAAFAVELSAMAGIKIKEKQGGFNGR